MWDAPNMKDWTVAGIVYIRLTGVPDEEAQVASYLREERETAYTYCLHYYHYYQYMHQWDVCVYNDVRQRFHS